MLHRLAGFSVSGLQFWWDESGVWGGSEYLYWSRMMIEGGLKVEWNPRKREKATQSSRQRRSSGDESLHAYSVADHLKVEEHGTV